MRLLVGGDEAGVSRQLAAHLTGWGHDCLVAPNASVALRMTVQCDFDIAVLDLPSPGVPPALLVSRIRRASIARFIYVILCAPRVDQDDVLRAVEAGADDYLFKPFDREVLR